MPSPCLESTPEMSPAVAALADALYEFPEERTLGARIYCEISKRLQYSGLRDFEEIFLPGLFQKPGLMTGELFTCLEEVIDFVEPASLDIMIKQLWYFGAVERFVPSLGVLKTAAFLAADPRFPKKLGVLMAEIWNPAYGRRYDLMFQFHRGSAKLIVEVKWFTSTDTSFFEPKIMDQIAKDFEFALEQTGGIETLHIAIPSSYASVKLPDVREAVMKTFRDRIVPQLERSYPDDPNHVSNMVNYLQRRLDTPNDLILEIPD